MTETLPEYELFAIRYAMRDAKRTDHFIGGDPHDAPMAMDYFLWVAKSPEHTFIIDTGFTEEVARKRGRTFLRDPIEALKTIGVDADKVVDGANFMEDLGADSLDTVELVMAFEEEFGVEIPDDAAETIVTVGDAIKFLDKASAA